MATPCDVSLAAHAGNCSSPETFEHVWARHCGRHSGEAAPLRFLPKLDLHCHLNGSISPPLLLHMECLLQGQSHTTSHAASRNEVVDLVFERVGQVGRALGQFTDPNERMSYCFQVFDNIYKVMTNIAFTRMVVQDLLLHSAAENMFILEIRTSLRQGLYATPHAAAHRIEAERVTKKAYVETVIHTVEHLMHGGLVDFETGALLPAGAPVSPTWWLYFRKLYGSLASNAMDDPFEHGAEADTTRVTHDANPAQAEKLLDRLREQLMHRMHVRLIVSINRGHDAEAAWEAVTLAKAIQKEQLLRFFAFLHADIAISQSTRQQTMSQYGEVIRRTCWVTGVDFSGHCVKNHFADFIPALMEARRGNAGASSSTSFSFPSYASLGITLHAAEKDDPGELAAMVKFAPDRWGHLVYTDPTNRAAIIARHDAIELCITSNTVTGGYAEVERHHIGDILQQQQDHKGEAECDGMNPELLQALTTESSLAAAMQCRVQRRLARWGQLPALGGAATAIPNVSFHTDDRGVFCTSVTEELGMLFQHGCLTSETGTRELSLKAMWALQRLSVPHVFELPLEVVYSCVYPWKECCCGCSGGDALAAHMSAHVAALDEAARAGLSCAELNWLLKQFDDM
ncbi:adenosine deaminase [Trypanosoma rangeli]|uniref:Adenosine deaminase n=1 Tax=Trypanosoma rangeli TaxID=5698 RepID=A0A3S5IS54_TRYRA|nr:adenosine deaminase [Trypanosoma rangeli]RNF09958.1 adenosine deaminase [Trypanosoma rangeli]|eukprot:RNF09958.1 adenosine deaminase [Trypanosoma rangeli]